MKNILIVEDDVMLLKMLSEFITSSLPDTNVVTFSSAEDFKASINDVKPDMALFDVMLKNESGIELSKELKHRYPLTGIMVMTGYPELSIAVDAIKIGVHDFIIKPFEPSLLLEKIKELYKNKRQQRENLLIELRQNLYEKIISQELDALKNNFLSIIEIKDPALELHTKRVNLISMRIGKRMTLSAEQLDILYWASIFHDIGKLAISDYVLLKPSSLTEEEREIVKMHTVYGEQILREQKPFNNISNIVRSHHEWVNGDGYPDNLKGHDIPVQARIIAIADAYDAMRSKRLYRPAKNLQESIYEIKLHESTQFDPNVTEVFFDLLREGVIDDNAYDKKGKSK
ncbi:MAG: response regulator [Deltaproteobacteria bacterium]|nr:response regulator [Deltaproteobacteria bacterium]MCL5792170.1 response regulator [Deltaproteobacteria bacterium]